MTNRFIPSESSAVFYAKELAIYVQNLKKIDRTRNWSQTEIEKSAYIELRNNRQELFENSQEWRIAIMNKYKILENNDIPKENLSEKKTPTARRLVGYGNPIEKGLNPHDLDMDKEFTGTTIKYSLYEEDENGTAVDAVKPETKIAADCGQESEQFNLDLNVKLVDKKDIDANTDPKFPFGKGMFR